MLLNFKMTQLKMASLLTLGFACLHTIPTLAAELDCEHKNGAFFRKICATQYDEQRQKLQNQTVTAFLITDAPLALLNDTHQMWYQRLQQCKKMTCFNQQLDLRTDQLNFFTSMNQSMTQHYLKYESGHLANAGVHLQIHQLSKNNIKIEGMAYRNPNNRQETQSLAFLAYTTADQKHDITNNESDCKYQFNFQKSLLKITTEQKGCERFAGVYRLYD